jgi:hypothetical protein
MRCMADEVMAACVRPRAMFLPMGTIDVATAAAHARALILRAKRYIVDDDVAAAAARLSVQHPDVLEQAFGTARPPVPVMWLEWSDEAQATGTGSQVQTDGTGGLRIGAVIEQVSPLRQLYRTTLLIRDIFRRADGQVIHKFVPVPFGFLHDLDRPLTASDRTDEDFMANGIGMAAPALTAVLMGSSHVGLVSGVEQRDPEFYRPDSFGFYEHRFKIAPDGRLLLSQSAKEKLSVDDEELENRFQTCQRMLRHVAHTFIRFGNHSYKSAFDNTVGNARRQIGMVLRELTTMHSRHWGFLMALMTLINSPELVDGGSSQRTGTGRAVGPKMVP